MVFWVQNGTFYWNRVEIELVLEPWNFGQKGPFLVLAIIKLFLKRLSTNAKLKINLNGSNKIFRGKLSSTKMSKNSFFDRNFEAWSKVQFWTDFNKNYHFVLRRLKPFYLGLSEWNLEFMTHPSQHNNLLQMHTPRCTYLWLLSF